MTNPNVALFWSLVYFLLYPFSLWRFYCLFTINSDVLLNCVSANCIWLEHVHTHTHTHTHGQRKVSLVKLEALQFHSDITGTTELVNLLFDHAGKEQASTVWSDVWAHSHICIYQIFSDPTHASVLCSELIFTGCSWLFLVFTALLLISIFISVCISTVSTALTSIGFLITDLEWKLSTKRFKISNSGVW